jgi:hypothetical protein
MTARHPEKPGGYFFTAINRLGHKYGRLTVIERVGTDTGGQATWLCECECGSGKLTITRGNHLAKGQVCSCGCLRTEAALRAAHSPARIHHGMARRGRHSPEYISYYSAKNRCNNPNEKSFAYYGGRGIKFLYTSFQEFFYDLGPKPDGFTVERINNFGHYEPGNCRWATYLEQANNKRNNRWLTAFGQTQTLTQWAQEYKISVATLYCRLDRGLTLEQALQCHPWARLAMPPLLQRERAP